MPLSCDTSRNGAVAGWANAPALALAGGRKVTALHGRRYPAGSIPVRPAEPGKGAKVTTPSARMHRRIAAFAALEDRLRAAGYAVRVLTDACHVQLVGRLPTGEVFSMRCRWDTCELDVGARPPVATAALPTEDEVGAGVAAAWRGELAPQVPGDAGWLDAEEVEAALHDLAARYSGGPGER